MNNSKPWHLEGLESRQLLSASVPAIAPLLDAVAVVAQPMVKTPNIIGTFTGTAVQNSGSKQSVGLTFTSQSRNGNLVGTTTKGGAVTGKIKGDTFTLTIDNKDGTVTALKGTVSDNGKKISGTFTNRKKADSGTFTMSR